MKPALPALTLCTFAWLTSVSLGQAADGFLTRVGPPERAALVLPASLRQRLEQKIGRPGLPLGYTYQEMLGFPPFEYRLRTIENLFRDVMAPAEFGGLIGDNLIAKANEPAQISYMLWSQLDARAGREWAVPKDNGDWGVPWIPKGTSARKALRLSREHVEDGPLHSKMWVPLPDPSLDKELERCPEALIRLTARLLVAAYEAAPYFKSALPNVLPPPGKYHYYFTLRQPHYDLLVSPYLGDVNDDTIRVADREAYETLRGWDENYAAFGAALFLRHFDAALAEWYANPANQELPSFTKTIKLPTQFGPIYLCGTKDDNVPGGGFLTIDLGGKDHYAGLIGTPADQFSPISLVLDLGEGNDSYDGTKYDGNIGCGLYGIGMVYDSGGNDEYKVKNGGIGFGLYGTGIVIDDSGNDSYLCGKGWGQGAAYAGVGLLLDRAGNDTYRSITMSMGFGGTMGVGTLVDLKGNDDYKTEDTGNHSKAWGKTVSMSMGSGYGRRCDSGDGQNQGGGFGIFVDAEGNDRYHTSIFSLGSGYWWGAGIFEDRAGDDTYRATHYCFGSGAHFAVGSFVDLAGNDHYNDRPDAVERWGGLGRDGSIAVCIDGGGHDVWGNLTGGHSDLNSYSLFWDVSGNDVYKRMQPFDPAQDGNRPFGSASVYPLMRNFRDQLTSVGFFLDTGGKDVYPDGMGAAENSEWQLKTGPMFWGYGFDGELP